MNVCLLILQSPQTSVGPFQCKFNHHCRLTVNSSAQLVLYYWGKEALTFGVSTFFDIILFIVKRLCSPFSCFEPVFKTISMGWEVVIFGFFLLTLCQFKVGVVQDVVGRMNLIFSTWIAVSPDEKISFLPFTSHYVINAKFCNLFWSAPESFRFVQLPPFFVFDQVVFYPKVHEASTTLYIGIWFSVPYS